MKTITQRDCILRVCDRWEAQYTPFDRQSQDKLEIYKRLQKLNLETCSANDVANAIGNSSWTTLKCDECGQETDWVLRVGEEPDYESKTACLCKACAGKLVAHVAEQDSKTQQPPAVVSSDGLADEFAYTKPPKNVFNIPDLCPACGGLGFTRGPGGIYDYRDCPNPNCKSGKVQSANEKS